MLATNAAISSFREAYVSTGEDQSTAFDFTSYAGRRARYALYSALYDASVYRSGVHRWSSSFRQTYGLYRYIRSIESPAASIPSFWQTHLFGGPLDMDAGDGQSQPSAIPILTDTAALRPALSQVWAWSNWAIKKDTFAMMGALLGDVGLRVVDDVGRSKVYLQLVHPSSIAALSLDPFGNVKAYEIQEQRAHPNTGKPVTYRELVEKDGDLVVYRTFLDTMAFAWPENVDARGIARAEWHEAYGFVPLVWLNHIDTGVEFGLSELHLGLSVFRELDDIASALDDQIRKAVNAPWLLAGVDDPKKSRRADPTIPSATPTLANAEPGRQEMPLLYGPLGATATPMVFPLDIAGTNTRIEALHAKLRRDYPELESDVATSAGDASGRALRVARQRAETKVLLRRATYDDGLARAQMMAVAIGGMRGAFAGFGLDSYAAGALDHRIGPRPVFAVDTMDEIEEETAFWASVKAAVDAGADLRGYLLDKGWDQQRVDQVAPEKAPPVLAPQLAPMPMDTMPMGATGG